MQILNERSPGHDSQLAYVLYTLVEIVVIRLCPTFHKYTGKKPNIVLFNFGYQT